MTATLDRRGCSRSAAVRAATEPCRATERQKTVATTTTTTAYGGEREALNGLTVAMLAACLPFFCLPLLRAPRR